ncbi:MAG: heme exporter protein CcmD [Alphaproteobacteria bacterium]|nr:heme exporter protein CcmD [Alphaproteobacteria bacterium]
MEKLSMGEYSGVVWAAYLVAAVVLGVCVWQALRGLRKAERTLKGIGE